MDLEPLGPTVDAFLDGLSLSADDPRSIAAVLLQRMAAGVDADRGWNVGLAREVRMLVAFLASVDLAGDGEVDEAQIRFLRDRIMARVST